jgi:hypothetical protein
MNFIAYETKSMHSNDILEVIRCYVLQFRLITYVSDKTASFIGQMMTVDNI